MADVAVTKHTELVAPVKLGYTSHVEGGYAALDVVLDDGDFYLRRVEIVVDGAVKDVLRVPFDPEEIAEAVAAIRAVDTDA